jgi:hypothetical protein
MKTFGTEARHDIRTYVNKSFRAKGKIAPLELRNIITHGDKETVDKAVLEALYELEYGKAE